MTPIEIRDALLEICKEIGPKACADIFISERSTIEEPLSVSCHPDGITNKHAIRVFGSSFEEAIASLRARMGVEMDKHHAARIREMAHRIIAVTYDVGVCTEAALRGFEFTQSEIDKYGARAVEEADDMAKGGPFQIRKLDGNGD